MQAKLSSVKLQLQMFIVENLLQLCSAVTIQVHKKAPAISSQNNFQITSTGLWGEDIHELYLLIGLWRYSPWDGQSLLVWAVGHVSPDCSEAEQRFLCYSAAVLVTWDIGDPDFMPASDSAHFIQHLLLPTPML